MTRSANAGLTMVETLVTIALLLTTGAALFLGMESALSYTEYLSQFHIAMNEVQGRLGALAAVPFDTLASDARFAAARPPNPGLSLCLGEDGNCNGILDPGEDRDGDGALDASPLPAGRLAVHIAQAPQDQVRNPGNPTLLDITVSACWSHRGHRLGEDTNCNGVLDLGSDQNGNGVMDAPAMAALRLGRRN